MKHLLVLLLTLGCGLQFLEAQEQSVPDMLVSEGRKILEHPEYRERLASNQRFTDYLISYISDEEGLNDPLGMVGNMMRLELGDEVRIYSWQMPDSLYRYIRFGLVAVSMKDTIIITRLEEVQDVENMQFRKLKASDWYGAIYYEAIPERKKNPRFYTLLGYAPGQEINEKFVDVIEIDKKGKPVFGGKVFHVDEFMDKTLNRPPMRLILRYGGDYAASVRWDEEESLIIMDHLSPPDAKLKGVYRMYGPDMSYDALRWDKKWWYLDKEVKFNSRQKIEIRPPDKPLDLPGGEKPR
jgi:hypothetical protein